MIVLDCCAAVEIARGTPQGLGYQSLMVKGEKIISSELFYAEVSNAFWKYVRAGTMERSEGLDLMGDAIELVDEFIPMQGNYKEAFHQSIFSGHSVYDMFYLTLARRNSATLVTFDKKLNALCDELGVDHLHEIDWAGLEDETED